MAIKAIDKLIPAGDFSLIDFNDVDQNVETIVTAGSYDPGATPVNGSKYVIDMNPGTGGSNLHANFSARLGADATNNLAQFDIIQYDSNAGVSGLFEIKFDASEKGEGNLIYVKDEDKYYFYTTTGGGDWERLDVIGSCGPVGDAGPCGMGGACGPVGGGGPVGTTGTCGVQGPQGAEGDEGSCGVLGYCGVRGTTGHCGVKGSSGACGLGYQGVTGTCGIKGTTGTAGSCGTDGTCGVKGTTGTCGIKGTTGTCGIKGTTGQQGSCGIDGTCGVKGTTGTCGIKGTTGACGLKGVTGHCGIAGTCGLKGRSAGAAASFDYSEALKGSCGITPTLGAGEFCTDQTYAASVTKLFIQPDYSTPVEWITHWLLSLDDADGGDLIIDERDQGTIEDPSRGQYEVTSVSQNVGTGLVTVDLAYKFVGTSFSFGSGNDGDNYEFYFTPKGTPGTCGIHGVSGACGYQGYDGACGLQGPSGTCGVKGTTGQQGSCGIKGTTGQQGSCGIKGTTGQQGSCGIKGTTGTAGTCGIKGTSGTAGTAGSCGFEGYCGVQGACGVETYNEFTRKYKYTIANTSPGATWFSAFRADDATAEANSANIGYIYINENDGYHDNSAFFTGIYNEAGYLVVTKYGPDDIHVRFEIISDSNEGSGIHKLGVKQIYGGTGDDAITFSSSAVYGMIWHPESPRKPFGIDIYQGMCGPQNAINITNTGACGTYNYGKITWFEDSNDQGSMHIDQARTFSLNVPKLLGGTKTEVLTINSSQSKFTTLVTVNSSTAGVPSATLSLSSKNLIFFNPVTGTGTHIFSNVTSSYGNTIYTVINAHATRSFRINNDITGVYVWRGLTRTIQPGGCITFATNANASKIYEINSVSAASHS